MSNTKTKISSVVWQVPGFGWRAGLRKFEKTKVWKRAGYVKAKELEDKIFQSKEQAKNMAETARKRIKER